MTETNVSASHFRVHLKEIANSVQAGNQAVTVERHGCRMFAVVSMEDLEFLRRHKYGAAAKAGPEKEGQSDPPEMITLIEPERMDIALVEEAYELTNGTTDEEIQLWRIRARHVIRIKRGRPPEYPACGWSDHSPA
jgi:hypothetical protein